MDSDLRTIPIVPAVSSFVNDRPKRSSSDETRLYDAAKN